MLIHIFQVDKSLEPIPAPVVMPGGVTIRSFLHLGFHPSFSHLAGIDPNWSKRGVIAVDRVVRMLNRSELGVPADPLVTYVDHKWTPGPSLKKVGEPRRINKHPISDNHAVEG